MKTQIRRNELFIRKVREIFISAIFCFADRNDMRHDTQSEGF